MLVVHNGAPWLPGVLYALSQQDYPGVELFVVDVASTDASPDILARRVPKARRTRLGRNVGFGRAVTAALREPLVAGADYVIFVHDDLVLAPDAISQLVAAASADSQLAVVGPKLRAWSEEPILQQVGLSIDRLGRPDTGIEDGELDQGQADVPKDTLYVSTAGMLVRTDVFRALRGFDPRMPGFGDDLDLCWRVWRAGWRVGVEPDAVGYHAEAGSTGQRPMWGDRTAQTRYLSERHILAATLKNTGFWRLAALLPLLTFALLGKLLTFSLVRRFADAGATLRAYLWNLRQLPATLKLRRQVMRRRKRSDADLSPLFASTILRLVESGNALRDRFVGGDTPSLLAEEPAEPTPRSRRDDAPALVRFVRSHPAAATGTVLAVTYLVGLIGLLGAGQLVGGSVGRWPAEATALLRSYASPISGDPLAGPALASPVQGVLGLLALAGMGSAWLAQRIVVLGLLPLAWVTALRAGRLVTPRPAPRALGATLYVLSPAVLGALAVGRLAELIVAALLPAIVLLTARVAGPATARDRAWRAVALLALVATITVAAAPLLGGAVVVLAWSIGLLVTRMRVPDRVGRPLLRLATTVVATLALLGPWLVSVVATGSFTLPPAPAVDLPAWRALLLIPPTIEGSFGTIGLLTGVLTAVVVLLALLLGLPLRPVPVAGLFTLFAASAALAWVVSFTSVAALWAPGLLIPGALAVAGLGVFAASTAGPALRSRQLGLSQIAVILGVAVLAVGLVAGVWRVAANPWDGLERDPELLPTFVAADTEFVGPYRVLLVDVQAGVLTWEATPAEGPSIASFGTVPGPVISDLIADSLVEMAAGDPDAGARLGRAGVRYVVLTDAARAELDDGVLRQPDLEPLAAGGRRVLGNRAWLPRAAVLPADVADRVLEEGSPGDLRAYEQDGLRADGVDRYTGVLGADEVLLMADAPGQWSATAGSTELSPQQGQVPLPEAFAGTGQRTPVTVAPSGQLAHGLTVGFQALLALLLISLMLRPPGFTRTRAPRRAVEAVDLVAAGALEEKAEQPLEDLPDPDEIAAALAGPRKAPEGLPGPPEGDVDVPAADADAPAPGRPAPAGVPTPGADDAAPATATDAAAQAGDEIGGARGGDVPGDVAGHVAGPERGSNGGQDAADAGVDAGQAGRSAAPPRKDRPSRRQRRRDRKERGARPARRDRPDRRDRPAVEVIADDADLPASPADPPPARPAPPSDAPAETADRRRPARRDPAGDRRPRIRPAGDAPASTAAGEPRRRSVRPPDAPAVTPPARRAAGPPPRRTPAAADERADTRRPVIRPPGSAGSESDPDRQERGRPADEPGSGDGRSGEDGEERG